MMKLSRYLKPYLAMLLVAVVLLFGQAILDLNLPNMMSNIVNVGITNSGIEEIAPTAISNDMYSFISQFVTADDLEALQEAYTPYSQLTPKQQQEIDKTYPEAAQQEAMVLVTTGAQLDAADTAFAHGAYAFISFIQELAPQGEEGLGSGDENRAEFDGEQLQQALPLLAMAAQAQPQLLQQVVDTSAATPNTLTHATATTLNKMFYQQLGADTDSIQTRYIFKAGAIMLLLSLLVMACAAGVGYCFARIGSGVARDLRRDIYHKVTSFTNAEMDQFSTSSLITRTTNDITQVQTLYTMGMRMLIFAPIMGIGGIIMALRKSLGMSWIIAVAVIILLGIIGILFAVVLPRFKKMQSLMDRLNLVSRENLSGIMVVRAFSNQKFQEKRFDDANKDLAANNLFVFRAMSTLFPVMMLIMNGISLFIIWLGAEQIAQSAIQVGDIMAFIQYAMQIIMAFLLIAMVFVLVPRASVSAERINQVLRSENTVLDPKNPKTFGGRPTGEIQFNNVSFRYSGAEEDVLHNINFTAKPGQTTAFIGSTGSGKSTLINLIPRFYDVSEGNITIDGIDVRAVTQHELRENIGYVPQKGLLFSGTVSSNLRLGDENASDETVREATQVAQALDFVQEMEGGFDAAISQGGTNVSGGQRQRLSIARALVKKAPVYIFDDSFSALDFATDARLRAAMKPYTQGATLLIVAQRVSTIMHAEQIVVLDQGNMVGIGTHEELLKTCEAYREIAQSQLSEEELA